MPCSAMYAAQVEYFVACLVRPSEHSALSSEIKMAGLVAIMHL